MKNVLSQLFLIGAGTLFGLLSISSTAAVDPPDKTVSRDEKDAGGRPIYPAEGTCSDIVEWLVDSRHMPLSFYEQEFPFESARVLLIDRLKVLRAKASLSQIEQNQLDFMRSELKQNPDNRKLIVDYKEPLFKFDRNTKAPDAFVAAMESVSSDYNFDVSNKSLILLPKAVQFPKNITLMVDGSGAAAIKLLQSKVLDQYKTRVDWPQPNDPLLTEITEAHMQLTLNNVDLPTCLSRFTVALGPNVCWRIWGPTGYRVLGFYQVKNPIQDAIINIWLKQLGAITRPPK